MNSKYKFPCGVLLSLALSLLVGCGGGGGGGGGGQIQPPQETLKSFTTTTQSEISLVCTGDPRCNAISANSLFGDPALKGSQFFLPDHGWGKIFVSNTSSSNATVNFFDTSFSYAQNPGSIIFYGKMMIMSDLGLNIYLQNSSQQPVQGHVFIWRDVSNITDWLNLGAPDDVVGTDGCDASSLQAPQGITVANGNLVVADTGNHRIIVYKGIPHTGDQAALVLGQSVSGSTDYNRCQLNNADTDFNNNPTNPNINTGVNSPSDLAFDGTNLVVADSYNNRVLMWNWSDIDNAVKSTTNLAPQSSTVILPFQQLSIANSTSFNNPSAVSFVRSNTLSALRLALADTDNNRILIWDSIPSCSTPAPATSITAACEATTVKPPTSLTVSSNLKVQGLNFTTINQLVTAINNTSTSTSSYVIFDATGSTP